MLFPITCVDNFFEEPHKIRDLAFSLPFDKKDGYYPGARTAPLHEANPEYFSFFCRKLFALFYDYSKFENVNWFVETCFQKIEPFEGGDEANVGWVHKDKDVVLAGIVYLSPHADLNSGTSIFMPKEVGMRAINADKRNEMFANNMGTEETKKALKENNDRFIETIRFQNVYNRMVCYGGEQHHGVNSYCAKSETRLTQVFFVKSVTADWYPVPHSKLVL